MTARESIGLADLELVTLRITEGLMAARPGCTLEISTYVWNRNPLDAQQQRDHVRREGADRRDRVGVRVTAGA
jgi:hypothetical protein